MRSLGIVVFFASGYSALLYQVVWQRLLTLFSGADVYAATIVVAAFMAGLGCGSLAGGVVADRVSRVVAVVLFAGAEVGIALFGLQSRAVLYDGLYERFGHLAAQPAVMGTLLFLVLLWPTFLMGASLPLLARALTRAIETAAGTIGWLYACNTMGAAIGALSAIWWFVPRHGLEGGLGFAAALNLACAGLAVPIAVALFRQRDPVATGAASTGIAGPPGESVPFGFATWVALYALSGFLALSLEIVWFRLLGVMLKSTAFTFGTLLAQYLFWLGAGAALGSVVARRVRRPAHAFLAVQAAAGAWAGLGLALLLRGIETSAALAWMREYLGGYDPMHPAGATADLLTFLSGLVRQQVWQGELLPYRFLWMYVAVPALLIGPTTLLLGAAFPLLQRVVQTDMARLGRRVGALLVANIAGSTAGAMITGWALLAWLGTPGTLRLLVALSAVFGLGAAGLLRGGWPRACGASVAAALAIAAVVAVPDSASLWSRLHGTTPAAVRLGEGASGLALLEVEDEESGGGVVVYLNGLGQSRLPYGHGTQTLLGALPAMIHPDPREAAVVGLGSGNTLAALAGRAGLERITSIEIIEPLIGLLQRSAPDLGYDGLTGLLADPRVEHVAGDGRAFLRRTDRRFDIIEADALRPGSAYSGNLYSVEYFELLRARLRPGGLAVTWAPTDRVERTFVSVFEHVLQYGGVLIGSRTPIVLDREAIARRLQDPVTGAYYDRLGIRIRDLLEPQVFAPAPLARGPATTDLNTDLFPRDEFDIPLAAILRR
jgi:spermidine synthase